MSARPPSNVIDYGSKPKRRSLRCCVIALAVAVSLLLGGVIATVHARRQAAFVRLPVVRTTLPRSQDMAKERAELEMIFESHRRALAELDARKDDLEVSLQAQREARRRPATRSASP